MVSHSRGHGCDACAQLVRTAKQTGKGWEKRLAIIRKFCSERGYTVAEDLSIPRAWRSAVSVMCKHHGAFQSTVGSLVHGKGCWKCFTEFRAGKQANADGAATFVAKARKVHGDAYDYSKFVYVDSYVKGEVFCKKHNKTFLVAPGNHVQGKGCPSCGVQVSHNEDEIAAFLKQFAVVRQRVRDVIAPRELDIYLPEHGLAIEYHGLYWHTEDRVGNMHFEKWNACADAGVELWQIFEDEWNTKRDVIQQRLVARLGRGAKVGARACTVVDVCADDAKVFFDRTHSQGGLGYSPVSLGLEHDGQLVAVATFGRQRNGAMTVAQGWEVLRYASVGTVSGGFGRLFAEFLRRHDPEEVVSFCDLRWGNGRMYQAVGFVLDRITPADYWWLAYRSGKHRIPRYQTQKHKLKGHAVLGAFYKEELTERQICEAAGWQRILGVGHQRWVWTRKP
jgi:cytochrome c2